MLIQLCLSDSARFEYRAAWTYCKSSSPALSLNNVNNTHKLTVWKGGGKGEGRGFQGTDGTDGSAADTYRIPRIILVGKS